MNDQQVTRFIAIAAIVIAVILAAIVIFAPQTDAPQEVQYDPSRQPSLLPLKEPSAFTVDAASGIFFDKQKINTSGTEYVGQVVTLSGSTWVLPNPTETNNGKIGVIAKVPATNISEDGQVLVKGLVYRSGWSLTRGTDYFADDVTRGGISANKNNSYPIHVGYAYNTSVLYVNPVINLTSAAI